jgi:hypothetical protein
MNRILKRILLFISVGGLVFILPLSFLRATDFSSSNFTVKDPVLKIGGGFSTSTNFQAWSSIGQEAIGLSSTTIFGLQGGFLYFPAVSVITATTSSPIVLGGGGGSSIIILATSVLPIKIPEIISKIKKTCDFNNDKKCDLVDLSIILYYYGKTGPQISQYDLNKNNKVDFSDVSILFYYWTKLV